MTKVSIEVDEPTVALIDGKLHACRDGGSQTEFSGSFDKVDRWIGLHLFTHPVGGSVWGMIVDDENIQLGANLPDCMEKRREVFPFVVSADED
jgi:hypothetical protein